MTFPEYWESRAARGLPADESLRCLAMDAWDAALCAAQAAKWEGGRLIGDSLLWSARMGNLHSWASPAEAPAMDDTKL